MDKLIKDGVVVGADDWQLLHLADSQPAESAPVPAGRVIVPLALWQAQRAALLSREDIGVWLASDARPEALAGDVARLPLIAVEFPKFTDGRGYTIAYRLRARYGYRGELRAFGDVLRDQLFYMQRVGFDAFALRTDCDPHDAVQGLCDFSDSYQQSWDVPPLFRRVQRQARRQEGALA